MPPDGTIVLPAVAAPETGHATMRLMLGAGTADQGGPFQTLAFRAAIHDDLDPPRAYPANARLQMGELRLRFDDRPRRIGLDRVDAIDIVSAGPFNAWVKTASWKVWVGGDNAREIGCTQPGSSRAGWRCLYGGVTTGRRRHVAAGQRGVAAVAGRDRSGRRPGVRGQPRLSHRRRRRGAPDRRRGDRWRFELGARGLYYALGQRGPVLRMRALQALTLARWFALRAGVETAGRYAQATGELVAYF